MFHNNNNINNNNNDNKKGRLWWIGGNQTKVVMIALIMLGKNLQVKTRAGKADLQLSKV